MSAVHIVFDAADFKDCARALHELKLILDAHDPERVRLLFAKVAPTKRSVANHRKSDLAFDWKHSGLSVRRFAKRRADENKSLPPQRRGGSGSTNPIALEKLLRRAIKELDDLL